MPIAPSNGIQICYDTFGDPADPPLLLVMGFTAQMTMWDEAFCRMLAGRGRHVIRFDNRDVGLSTKLDDQPVDVLAFLTAKPGDVLPPAPYTLSAFSDDAFGLLTHLGIERAHIAGASMGGMIVQTMAIEHPERVLTMTSIMSCPGPPESDPEAMAALMAPPATNRDEAVQRSALARVFCSPRYHDATKAAQRAGEAWDRAPTDPMGVGRQLVAIRSSPDRTEALRGVRVPSLVIHGRADKLILPTGGEATAAAIPGANLLMLKDMGHDLPEPLWPVIVDAIVSHTTHAIG